MAHLARVSAATVPPDGDRPTHRPAFWWTKPFRLAAPLLRAWRSQAELWERWYAAPYKDDGPLRWQRRDGVWVLDGALLSSRADRRLTP